MGCSRSIACYPAKIPHFLENLKILAFYAILPSAPLIACESFIQALLSGFERFVCRLARPSNRWLKRPTPNASRRCPPFKSSTAARSCSYGLFPWAALLRFAFGQKIWHTIFFSSKPNFKIFPKLLLRRGASQSPKNWHVTVHLRYPAWNTCACWLAKIPLLTRCYGISVLLRRCLAPRLKNCVNSFLKA